KIKEHDCNMRVYLKLLFWLLFSCFWVLFADEMTINKLSMKGNKKIKSSEIMKQLNLKPNPAYKKMLFWTKKPDFDSALLRQDEENIIRYLQSNGYLYAELETVLKQKRNQSVNILYKIKENRPVRINSVNFTVNDTISIANPVERRRRVLLFQQPSFFSRKGTIFTDSAINMDKDLVNNSMIRRGYLKSETDFTLTLTEDPEKRNSKADIDFNIQQGNLYYVNSIISQGSRNTDRATIRNQITLKDSMVYRARTISESRDNLMWLGVFRSVQIYPSFIDDTRYVNAIFNFTEQPKWTATTGFGFGTEDRFRAKADLTHHNIFKKADQQELSIRTSYIEPWNLQFRWIQPAFLYKKVNLTLNPFYKRKVEDYYSQDSYGNNTTFSYPFIPNWTLYMTHQYELNKDFNISKEIDEDKKRYNLSTVSSKLDLNYSMPKFNPVEGFHVITGAGVAGVGTNNNYNYYFLGQEFRYYQPLYNAFLLAYRGAYHTQEELNSRSEIPLPNRYKLGGMQTVRGWNRNKIGPEDGGRSSLLINVEARIPLFTNFNMALLYDAGHVLEKAYAYDFEKLEQSVGIGFRYVPKIGVIRTDFASPLHDLKDLKWYLTIGESF
ncbi:MAG: BamA/TamA family outer membrane protein, partial [Candidatus Cloacimonetes bacterium]|nr:BamA/TamA family outer membrane protein [Candidatus Cloacimonadota bacterium]